MTRGMIIAQISDTHLDADGPSSVARLRDFERCVAAIDRLDPPPDVVVHTGDVAHNGKPEEYEAARRILGTLRCPVHILPGNRDNRAAMRAAFPADPYLLSETSFIQYSVDTFPVRLIVVDTVSQSGKHGEFCRIRADKLRARLAEETARPTVIFMHHPPFEVLESDYPIQFTAWESVERMGRALDGQAHVVGMFCGHTHRASAGELGAIQASSTPSVAVDLRQGDYPAEFKSAPLYKLHRFDARRGLASEIRAA